MPRACGVQKVPHGSGTAVWGGMGRYGVVGGLLRLVLVPRQHRAVCVHELRSPFCERSLLSGRGESGVPVLIKPNSSKTAPKPQRRVVCVTKRFCGAPCAARPEVTIKVPLVCIPLARGDLRINEGMEGGGTGRTRGWGGSPALSPCPVPCPLLAAERWHLLPSCGRVPVPILRGEPWSCRMGQAAV